MVKLHHDKHRHLHEKKKKEGGEEGVGAEIYDEKKIRDTIGRQIKVCVHLCVCVFAGSECSHGSSTDGPSILQVCH